MKFKKLNLIACDGYGLQAGKNLIKIQKETVIINFSYDVLYILNEKGDIICTLLPDNAVYESEANRDRRYQNNQNGFDINWDEENEMCTVTCIARKNGSTIAKKIKSIFGKQAETIKATAEYLHDTPDDLLEKENLKNEQEDTPRWEAAKSAHTIEAYTQYLNIYDVMPPRYRGRHVNDAIVAKGILEHIQSETAKTETENIAQESKTKTEAENNVKLDPAEVYTLRVTLSGNRCPEGLVRLECDIEDTTFLPIPVKCSNASIPKRLINNNWSSWIRVHKSIKSYIPVSNFTPRQFISRNMDVDLAVEKFALRVNMSGSVIADQVLKIDIKHFTLDLPIKKARTQQLSLYLPQYLKPEDMKFHIDDNDVIVSYQSGIVTITDKTSSSSAPKQPETKKYETKNIVFYGKHIDELKLSAYQDAINGHQIYAGTRYFLKKDFIFVYNDDNKTTLAKVFKDEKEYTEFHRNKNEENGITVVYNGDTVKVTYVKKDGNILTSIFFVFIIISIVSIFCFMLLLLDF